MSIITPSDNTKEDDYESWKKAVGNGLSRNTREILLIHISGELVGFFQYYTNDGTFMMEEIQILPEFHGKGIFRTLYAFVLDNIPRSLTTVEAYADKKNSKSLAILNKLGLRVSGECENGRLYRLSGSFSDLIYRLNN